MHFAGWPLPLQADMEAREAAGFAIVWLREPPPDRADTDTLKRWSRVPLFRWINARPLD